MESLEGVESPGWVLPYLHMVGRFCGDDPHFEDFQSNWVPILYPNTIQLTPSFCRKIGLSLSHLVPEILGPKFGLIFHQNVSVNRFEAFCINFLLDFQSNWPFSLILDLFDPSFSQNLRSDWVQNVFACWTWLLKIWWSTPHQGCDSYQHTWHSAVHNKIIT